jgi:Beta-propeller repeat
MNTVAVACFVAGFFAGLWAFHLAGAWIAPTTPPASETPPTSTPSSSASTPPLIRSEPKPTEAGVSKRSTHSVEKAIFVANRENVAAYSVGSNGNVIPLAIISGPATGLSEPSGITVDDHGDIYVVNHSGFEAKTSINVYPPGANGEISPTRTIAGPATDLHEPTGIALDAAGNIYITNGFEIGSSIYFPGDGDVAVYPRGSNGNVEPIARIIGRDYVNNAPHYWIYRPVSLALDTRGFLYVLNGGDEGVAKFRANSNGKTPPIAQIAGPLTALVSAAGIAVDGRGNIFIADSQANAVMEYAAGSRGNQVPFATISGPSTGLSQPKGIALDEVGNIYVTNRTGYQSGSVTVYSPGHYGNVVPKATISGPFTELSDPWGIAVGRLVNER